ncbi:MAG: sigma-70 family RNA polymerase sigma factor [bacterium]|nr:sigma-70 family RNA polymerase sigma factor [bacterium]MCP5044153.1 sigma-70 family RNA polymerase sigma factor [bacterium]
MRDADPDVQHMLAFCAGDEAAFDPLFDRWARPLLHYLQRIVDDAATAEELVQEAFLRVYRARDRYRPDAKFSTWLYRIGTNLALNELRRPRRTRPHANADEVGDQDHAPLRLVAQVPGADAQLETRWRASRVEHALGKLPERQRMAIWLSAVEGMSYVEVAVALETTEKSVKSLIHRGRVALAECMAEKEASAGARAREGNVK